MPSAPRSLWTSVAEFFAIDDDWERPVAPLSRRDWVVGIGLAVFGIVMLEMVRSVTELYGGEVWVQWVAVASGGLLMVWRRQHPVLVGVLAAAHMFIVGVTMPMVMGQISLQTVYFVAIFSAVAYARHRRSALLVVAGITVFMFLWVAWQLALGGGIDEVMDQAARNGSSTWVSPTVAAVVSTVTINMLYFVGAIIVGQISWRSARQRASLEEQAETIAAQADSLRRRAVVDERLRISRELHDVVGHHVAVIGVQAGAARRVLDKRPADAATALGQIEASSRDAVTQMRSLLGTLRDIERTADSDTAPESDRAPEPGLDDLAGLVAERDANGQRTAYTLVESRAGLLSQVPRSVALSLYRIVQEALANSTRHSTASAADVVLRIEESGRTSYVEVEVTDDGRPRFGTSGSGMGQLGMRERAASHHGSVDIGPRPTGGYRVRVRIPLGDLDD